MNPSCILGREQSTSPSVLPLLIPPPHPVGPTAALQAAGPARPSAVAVATAVAAGLFGPATRPAAGRIAAGDAASAAV